MKKGLITFILIFLIGFSLSFPLHSQDIIPNPLTPSHFSLSSKLCRDIECHVSSKESAFSELTITRELNNNQLLLKQGQSAYQKGDWQEAIKKWQQVKDYYQRNGDTLHHAQLLSLIALAYQKQGKWTETIKNIEQSVKLIEIDCSANPPSQVNFSNDRAKIKAQICNNRGSIYLEKGDPSEAFKSWQTATNIYQKLREKEQIIGSLINQAKALESLGKYAQSYQTTLQALGWKEENFNQTIIQPLNQISLFQPSPQQIENNCWNNSAILSAQQALAPLNNRLSNLSNALKVISLVQLSNNLREIGEINSAELILRGSFPDFTSLPITQQNTILISLANTEIALAYQAKNYREETKSSCYLKKALTDYQSIINHDNHLETTRRISLTQINARINMLRILIDTHQWEEAEKRLQFLQAEVFNLSPSYQGIYAQINLANLLITSPPAKKDKRSSDALTTNGDFIINLLNHAIEDSYLIDSQQNLSYAKGTLGKLYQTQSQLEQAQTLTEEALNIAQAYRMAHIAYRWQWQLGQINQQKGERNKAISFYNQAIQTLDSLRNDLVSLTPDIQYNFRDEIEPIYREFVSLLLDTKSSNSSDLKQARETIEKLQIAEINNFFREVCLTYQPEVIDQVIDGNNQETALIYGIVLSDKLELILKLPQQDLQRYSVKINPQTFQNKVNVFNNYLKDRTRMISHIQQESQALYNVLIQPLETSLTNNKINTLVFVLDDLLRSIPMATLYDGQQYLIEKYAIGINPTLQLITSQTTNFNTLSGLIGGSTFENKNSILPPLPHIKDELNIISSLLPTHQKLLNEDFNQNNLKAQLNTRSFNLVHLATHGQFSSNPNQTFLLLGEQLLIGKDFKGLLQATNQYQVNPIELLVLSACQTATGDQRATLGLAGIAVQAGSQSTIATLWNINDNSTAKFMAEFYYQLTQNHLNKAQALQQAQLTFIKQSKGEQRDWEKPYYWSAFILIGSWI